VSDAILAGQLGVELTVWLGRVGGLAVCVHGAAWLAFLAAWDKRPLSRFERTMVVTSVIAGLVSMLPNVAVDDTVTIRTLPWLGISYSDPDASPLGIAIMALSYVAHVAAALAALRMSRRNRRARAVAIGLGVFCIVIPLDLFSAIHVLDLPYLADPAVAFVFLSIGSVVALDAAEGAEKSAELERARVALAERDNLAALGQLAAVVAHEVRNPVAVIFGALATLQRPARSEEDANLLGIVGEEAERLKQLVTRLLEAVRPFELQYSSRAARHVIQAAVSQVTTSSGVAATQVELVSVPTDEVECDEVLLVQAIANLVQNALGAIGRRAPVRVRAVVEESSRPAMLRVEIDDDGEGVPPAVRALLFTPFFTTRATGTGLGLALVKRIAGAHGGTVDYATPQDGGASFVLRVPLRASEATPRRLIGNDLR
jgi:signal transduction histidine kinase